MFTKYFSNSIFRPSAWRWAICTMLLALAMQVQVFAQPNISRVEYYIDTDPGFGNATALNIGAGGTNLADLTIPINPNLLSQGVHRLYVRAGSANGWSLTNSILFYKPITVPPPGSTTGPAPNLTRVEYYIDTDPGFGKANTITIGTGTNFSDIVIPINPASLTEGVHRLYVRAGSPNGWSLTNTWLFYKPITVPPGGGTGIAANLKKMEYYIDEDPGIGLATPVAIDAVQNISDLIVSVNVTGLATGEHQFQVRSQDNDGKWSLVNSLTFNIPSTLATPAIVVNGIQKLPVCAKDNISVSFDATGTYNAGNVFNLELSNSSGSFATPTVVGTLSGTTDGIINGVLPDHLTTGSGYKLRIRSTNPVVTGVTSLATLTINDRPSAKTITGRTEVNGTFTNAYSVATTAGSIWQWTIAGGSQTTGTNTNSINVQYAQPAGTNTTGSVKVIETSQAGCIGDESVLNVNIYKLRIDNTPAGTSPCKGSALNINVSIDGAIDAGNIYTAQLSDASGSFAAPVAIGTVSADGNGINQAAVIAAVIPAGTTNGTGYRIRVVSSAPSFTGSQNSTAVAIETPATPTASATVQPSCTTGTGTIVVTAPTGAGITYSIGGAYQASGTFSNVLPGTYNVTAQNAAGCISAAASVTVNQQPPTPSTPTITPSGATTFCTGGSVTLTSSAATSYLWSTGATTQSIVVSTGGTYTVSVQNSNGCTSTVSAGVLVTVNSLPTVSLSPFSAVCNTIAAFALTGGSPAGGTYSGTGVSNGQFNPATAGVGTHTITYSFTNANNCTNTAQQSITVNECGGCTATITPGGPLSFCEGGSVTLTASAGASYLWSTGATTQSITVSSSGSYTVTVIDANSCSATSSAAVVTVNPIPATPTITPAGPTTFCAGGSVTLTSSTAASYLWSTGATTQSIVVNSTGSYSVTVSSAAGCSSGSSATTGVTVNPLPAVPTITPTGATTFCAGGSVTLSSSVATSYLWSTGATTQSIVVNSTGSYTVTITNANNCSATSAATGVTVNALPTTPTITPNGSTTFCEGGSVTLSSSAATSYLWSTGATAQSIVVNSSGSYSVTVTNANNCSATSLATSVTVNPLPVVSLGAFNAVCNTIPAFALTGGTPAGGTYSGAGVSNGQFNPATAGVGTHVVTYTYTNANNCTNTAQQSIMVNDCGGCTPGITPGGPTTFCEGGSVTLTASAGVSYLWSTGATTQSISVSSSGSYTVTVTNADNCTATTAATVVTVNPLPATPTITASGATTFCESGSITLTSSAAASYLWSTGATTQSIEVNSSGSYTVTVKSAAGCSSGTSATTSVTVNPLPAVPTITPNGTTTFCEGGSVTLTSSAAASYLWSTGATTQSVIVSSSGSYTVTASNANNCSATSAATSVTVNPLPSTPTITPNGSTTFCEGGSVTLTSSAAASYLWSTGATTQSIVVNSSGSYTVTVTNANNCSATSAATAVTVNPLPVVGLEAFNAVCNTIPAFTLTGGTPAGGTYSGAGVSNGQFNPATAGVGTHVITYTYTNANSCTNTAQQSVTVNDCGGCTPGITPGGPTTFCEGGSVTLTASAGVSYLWSTGATTQSISVNTSGSYTVTVTNADNCTATTAATVVTVNPLPATPTITPGGPTTFCEGGSVTLTSSAAASYLWNNGETIQSIVVNSTGSFSVTVKSAAGCSSVSSAVTSVEADPNPATPDITPNGSTTFCEGGSVTLTSSEDASWLWSTGATTQSITVNSSGSYSVTVISGAGCSSAPSLATIVTVNPLPVVGLAAFDAVCNTLPAFALAGGTPAGGTYSGAGVSSGQFNPATAGVGTHVITYTYTNANNCTNTAEQSITVNDCGGCTPGITPGGPTTFCEGGSVTLTASAGVSYLWSNGATTQSITVSSNGTFTVTVTNDDNCSATSAAVITAVTPSPEKPTITPDGPTLICPGASVTLTSSVADAYLWSNGLVTQSITVGGGSYSVIARTENNCYSEPSDIVTITFKESPSVGFLALGPVCVTSEPFDLSGGSPAGGVYSGNAVSNGQFDPEVAGVGQHIITYTYTNEQGCSNSIEQIITVNGVTPVSLSALADVCSIAPPFALTGGSPAGGVYFGYGVSNGQFDPAAAGIGQHVISYTYVNEFGCANSAEQTITVKDCSGCTASVEASGPPTFCAGGSVTLTATKGASYLWSNGATTQSINVSSSGTFTVTVTNANNCSATSEAVTVTVNPIPVIPTITSSGATSFCQGGSVTLTSSAAASYLWSNGATTQSITVTSSGSYSVKVKNAAGCSSASSAAVQVTVTNCGTYCAAGGTKKDKGYISRIYFRGIANFSGWNNGYGDFTSLTANVSRCNSYFIVIVPANTSRHNKLYTKVWIDWNQDGDFDDKDEQVFTSGNKNRLSLSRIRVPCNAKTGKTRMRVAVREGRIPSACGKFEYGEVEDYTVAVDNDNCADDYSKLPFNPEQETSYRVMPNPASSEVVIVRTSIDDVFMDKGTEPDITLVTITDASGKIVLQKKMYGATEKVNVSRFVNGTYFIRLQDDDSVTVQKVIVMH